MAYRVAREHEDEVLAQLDEREQGGYERVDADLHFEPRAEVAAPRRALLYLATSENVNYLGPASLEQIAGQVRGSEGPSGHNVEYVLRLAEALRALQPDLCATQEETLALAALLTPAGEA